MKKILSLFISLLSFILISTVNVSAEVDKEVLADEFYDFCNSKIVTTYEHDYVKIGDYVEADGKVFFTADCSWIFMHQMIVRADSMGDWYFMTSPCENGISGLGVYVKSRNEIYTIENAWEEGIVTDLTPVSKLDGLVFYHIGDVNGDKVLNIKDATALQKYLANKETKIINNNDIRKKVFDMNEDERINIKDATTIQKYIAKMDY